MKIDNVTNVIANALEVACGLDVTPNALEAIQEALDSCAEPAKEHDLEVWRQAYNAAITRICVRPIDDQLEHTLPVDWRNIANWALADYRAKREEIIK